MRLNLYLLVIAMTSAIGPRFVRSNEIIINLAENVTTDLRSYLDDLRVVASSVQYSAALNAKLVNDLESHLQNGRVRCDGQPSARPNSTGLVLMMPFLSWNEARKRCMKLGMKLATIDSPDKLKDAVNKFNFDVEKQDYESVYEEFLHAHVGIHSLLEENDWLTITNEPLNEFQRRIGNLLLFRKSPKERCAALTYNQTLTSIRCDKQYSFFCETPNS